MGLLNFNIPQARMPQPVTPDSLSAAAYNGGLLNNASAAQKPPAAPQGLLSRIGAALNNSDHLQAIGAGLHDLGTGQNTLDGVLAQLQEQQRARTAQLWQSQLQDRQQQEWKSQDQQRAAATNWAQNLPPGTQRDIATVDPTGAFHAYEQNALQPADTPLTPQQMTQYHIQPGTSAVMRGGRVEVLQNPKAPSAAQLQADSFTPEDIDFYAQAGLRQGGLPRYISIRSPLVPRLLHRMREMASAQNIPPERLASIEAAYHGDRHAYEKLNETYNNVVAFERTTDSFLNNLQTLARRLPANQISDSGFMNQAIQAYNHHAQQDPALSAYIGALVSTRMELARTLGGSVSPPVESMHDAEAILPNDVGYRALQDRNGVATNIHNEMQLRGQSLGGTLDDMRSRIESGELPMPGGAIGASGSPPPPPGGGNVIRYDAQGRRIP